MHPAYISKPAREILEEAARGLDEKWDFPNCVGIIDVKHVTLTCTKKSGSQYFFYMQSFSFVLMTIVGPDYKFVCAHIGGFGNNSEGRNLNIQ
jgi:hypothetical protein